jgi:hypothetical protein
MKETKFASIGVSIVAMVFVSACATLPQASDAEPSGSGDRITESEMSVINAVDAYGVVKQLRPQWLRSRGAMSLRLGVGELPVVYVDDLRAGDLLTLQTIPIIEVAEIRYINARDATTRWGTGVAGGVIEVIRKGYGAGLRVPVHH